MLTVNFKYHMYKWLDMHTFFGSEQLIRKNMPHDSKSFLYLLFISTQVLIFWKNNYICKVGTTYFSPERALPALITEFKLHQDWCTSLLSRWPAYLTLVTDSTWKVYDPKRTWPVSIVSTGISQSRFIVNGSSSPNLQVRHSLHVRNRWRRWFILGTIILLGGRQKINI